MRRSLWAPLGVALVVGGVVSAVSVRPLTLEELCGGAEEIVFARVASARSAWVDQRIETTVTLAVHESWKGAPSGTVEVVVPGGTVGNVTMRASEAPTFREKDDVVAFLRKRNGRNEVYGWFRGQYTVVGSRIREIPNTTLAAFRANVAGIVAKGGPR
jgi:hypothetical protein